MSVLVTIIKPSRWEMKCLALLLLSASLCRALVTLDTIRNLTGITEELTGWIGDGDGNGNGNGGLRTVTAALRVLCKDILTELEKPLSATIHSPSSSPSTPLTNLDCARVRDEYHAFIAATVRFLHVVQEHQMRWNWSTGSGVFQGISWMQALWASRRTHLSFIEQQMSLYAETGCFRKSKEVLRRDVEVVEYLNDLMDLFRR
ncbi:hypothetical protein BUE80_DR011034 [Diplocarpon rosae]|nr:hypothetical protein BUE80_DR011034 [Diplocarpon rosae]